MRWWYYVCQWWCRGWVSSAQLGRVYGRENVPDDGPLVLVSNHQSYFDPVLVGYSLKRELHYMARDTLFTNPVFGKIISSVNAYPVKRGEADVAAIKTTLRLLKDAHPVLLFPEGTRTRDGRVGEMKPGFTMLASRGRAQILPVAIDGAYEAWPRTFPLPIPLRPIHVAFGKPYSNEEVRNTDEPTLIHRIRRDITQLQNMMRQHLGKPLYHYPEYDERTLPAS